MRTLLLADDSVTVQRVIALTFAEEAFRIVTVSDGQAAIERISSQRPDIVLAGTTMPNVNGYEVASFVRSQPALKNLPVLLLSGAFESVDPAQLKASGASGVLEKPLEPTIVISRVKELLGIKTEARPATGRTVTPAAAPPEKRKQGQREAPPSSQIRPQSPRPVRAAKASSWDELKEDSGLAPDARSVEGGHGSHDYLDTLDAAFDSLDQHLAGRGEERHGRNPAPPLEHHGTAVDPRLPGRRPPAAADTTPASPIFEIDDEWFADEDKIRDERRIQHTLAAEMGIHDVDLPETPEAVNTAAPAADLDFDFGLDDEPKPTLSKTAAIPAAPSAPPPLPAPVFEPPPAPVEGAPVAVAPVVVAPVEVAPVEVAPVAVAPVEVAPVEVAPVEVAPRAVAPSVAVPAPRPAPAPVPPTPDVHSPASRDVADDFADLLAFEQGERSHPPMAAVPEPPPPVVIQPEITDAMLDQIAERVVERLNAGLFADHLREAMTTTVHDTVRDTVRTVVSETSERLLRDEIARVKAQAERDTP